MVNQRVEMTCPLKAHKGASRHERVNGCKYTFLHFSHSYSNAEEDMKSKEIFQRIPAGNLISICHERVKRSQSSGSTMSLCKKNIQLSQKKDGLRELLEVHIDELAGT